MAVGLFAVSLIFLILTNPSNPPKGFSTSFAISIQNFINTYSKPVIVSSLIAGIVAGIIKRSFKASSLVLLGVFFGSYIGYIVSFAIAGAVVMIIRTTFPLFFLAEEGPGLNAAIALVAFFVGPIIGAIWGGVEGLALYTSIRK
ncbi:hypothetical protein NDI45_20530 [Leptolyngbya sp. GB1-A1]